MNRENVDAIVLIVGNANLANPYTLKFSTDTTGECPVEIGGTTKISWRMGVEGKQVSGTYTATETLQYNEEHDEYVLKTRSMTCTYSDTTDIEDEYMPMHGYMTGSGSSYEEYAVDEAPLKIRFDTEDDHEPNIVFKQIPTRRTRTGCITRAR